MSDNPDVAFALASDYADSANLYRLAARELHNAGFDQASRELIDQADDLDYSVKGIVEKYSFHRDELSEPVDEDDRHDAFVQSASYLSGLDIESDITAAISWLEHH